MRLRLRLALAIFLAFSALAQAGSAVGGPPPDLSKFLPPVRPLRLAESLFAEADYPAAAVEARIAMRGATDPYVLARANLVRALADLRRPDALPGAREQAAATLENLWTSAGGDPESAELGAFAACELGRFRMALRKGDPDALPPLAHAFLATRNATLFRLAGSALDFLFAENPGLADAHPELADQVAFSVAAWPSSVRNLANPRRIRSAAPSPAALSARAFIAFYRTQISPAIGSRCALTPSCSGYFLQAARKHGLLCIPLIGDRFIRESDVTQAEKVLVERGDGSIRIADPVSDHDFWFAKSP